jgi:hypothetical protein
MFHCKSSFVSHPAYMSNLILSCSAAHPVGSSIMLLGGFGFLSRMHGLSIDNLVEVEMVLADGRIVIASENDYPGISLPLLYSILCSWLARPVVGSPGSGTCPRGCHAVQSQSVSHSCSFRWKPPLVGKQLLVVLLIRLTYPLQPF